MKMIVAVDDNWAIGNNGELLKRIPADMKRFVELTTGKVVVMGRKTLESLPEGKPLKNRTNIVLTSNYDYQVEGAIVVHNIEELRKVLFGFNYNDVFVIGGGKVYRDLLEYCDRVYVTKIKSAFEADTFFPNLDKFHSAVDKWEIEKASGVFDTNDGTGFQFVDYVRTSGGINLVQDVSHQHASF